MSDNALEDLRDRTEENDIESFLKPSLGGFTKKSVLEYLSYLKKQQQDQKDAFAEELRHLQSDKENLLKESASLEADLNEAIARITADEDELGQCRQKLEEEQKKTEAALSTASKAHALFESANAKNEELNQVIFELMNAPGEKQTEQTDASPLLPEVDMSETDSQLTALLSSAESMKAAVALQVEALGEEAKKLEEITRGKLCELLGQNGELREEVKKLKEQNELLENEKEELSRRIEELNEQNLALGRENSRVKAANIMYQRKLKIK